VRSPSTWFMNLGAVWLEASLTQRRQIQRAMFPEGLPFDGREFGTAPTCLAFCNLRATTGVEDGMASPRAISTFRLLGDVDRRAA
jgi:hypothetical protein